MSTAVKKLGVVFALCAFLLAGMGRAEAGEKIRVGTMAYFLGVPLQVIQDEKLDEKFGVKIEVINFPSGGPMAEALGAGQWDIGPIGAGGMIAVPTYDAKLIADVQYEADTAWIFARPDSDIVKAGNTLPAYPDVIGSAAAVKGKTMLGTFGNISQYMGFDYAEKLGLKPEDIEFLHMETSQIYTAFVTNNGDIACIGSPSAAFKLKAEGYPVIGGLKQQGVSQQDAILVSADFYKKHRDACVRFMQAWYTATAKLNSDAEYAVEKTILFYENNGRTDVTEDAVRAELALSNYVDPTNYKNKPTGKWMTGLVEFMVKGGFMDDSVLGAMAGNIKTDIAEEALAKLAGN